MAILKAEWKWHIRFLRGWILSILLTTALFMSFYAGFADGMDELAKMLEGFPREVLLGFGLDMAGLGSYSGFLAYIYTFVQLLLGIAAVSSGMQLMGREKLSKSSEFLFSKPVSRTSIWLQKNAVGLLGLLLINGLIAALVFGLAYAQNVSPDDALLHILIGSFLVQLILFLLGGLLANVRKRLRSVTGPATSVAMGLYFILLIGRILEEEKLSLISIYGLFDTSKVQSEGLEPTHIVIALVLCALLALASYLRYTRMDVEV